jgi:uncharacterized Zn-finger protein
MSSRKENKTTLNIKKSDLPLSCPRENYLELSHPKIFLPIDKQVEKKIECPYCSTIYKLIEDD